MTSDISGDRNRYNDIAPGTTRNQFRRGKEGRLDLRLAREITLPHRIGLTAVIDVFNVLNAAHYRDVDNMLYTADSTTLFRNPQFGERSNAADLRVVQLGVTISF